MRASAALGLALLALTASLAARAQPAPALAAVGVACYGGEPALPLSVLEGRLLEEAQARGQASRPVHSAALSRAAREIAAGLAKGERGALERGALRLALVRACAFDPDASVLALAARPEQLPALLFAELREHGFTHLGIGVVRSGRFAHAVLLGSRRRIQVGPFPRDLATGSVAVLRGRLVGLAEPWVVVRAPDGVASKLPAGSGPDFEARVPFEALGRFVVEVGGTGPRGPEVAAYLVVSTGGAGLDEPARPQPEPDPIDLVQAEERVVAAVNALRALHGLAPLTPSEPVSELARRYSLAMRDRQMVAHLLPGGAPLQERLERACVACRRVRENLAAGETAMAAEQSLEESPAHLANLLDPLLTHVGVGLARDASSPGGVVVYLSQILFTPPLQPAKLLASPIERVREALRRERQRLGGPTLVPDPRLDEAAARVAGEMLRAKALRPESLAAAARWRPQAARLAALPDQSWAPLDRSRVTVADTFATSIPEEASKSPHLGDSSLRSVGVGVAASPDAADRDDRFWIAVLYGD